MSRDPATVRGFGYEWARFDQSALPTAEAESLFGSYFAGFPWDSLVPGSIGLDVGCGSGRWARIAATRGYLIVCVDPSLEALGVARRNAASCLFALSSAGELPFAQGSIDFGYSLGVLHHSPQPLLALRDIISSLRPGAPFLVYVYYALEDRPHWYRLLWRATDRFRRIVSRSPYWARYAISQLIAFAIYFPLARLSRFLEDRGRNVDELPLSAYRHRSLYTMRTDALDRFGTRLERRYSKEQLTDLLEQAGFENVTVAPEPPYWRAIGFKATRSQDLGGDP